MVYDLGKTVSVPGLGHIVRYLLKLGTGIAHAGRVARQAEHGQIAFAVAYGGEGGEVDFHPRRNAGEARSLVHPQVLDMNGKAGINELHGQVQIPGAAGGGGGIEVAHQGDIGESVPGGVIPVQGKLPGQLNKGLLADLDVR